MPSLYSISRRVRMLLIAALLALFSDEGTIRRLLRIAHRRFLLASNYWRVQTWRYASPRHGRRGYVELPGYGLICIIREDESRDYGALRY